MRAVVYAKYGPPDVLRLEDVPKPVPKDDELLIRVFATTVNRTDCGFLRARPYLVRLFMGITKPKRTILGNEFAGEIEAIGKDVASFAVGQKVFGFDGINLGAHAEYMTTPEKGLVATMPAGMSWEQAAPSTEGAHYALNLIQAAGIAAGQRVLVNGATGAIGSAAVQLLKHLGADVTAVCDTKNIALVESLGADKVIDYTTEDFTRIADVFDVVLDAVGKSSFRRCRSLLKPGGIYLSTDLGFLAQNPILGLITPRLGRSTKKVLFPFPHERKAHVILLKELMEAGEFTPVVDRSYPLEQIVEAYDYVEAGMKTGNVVIRVVETGA
jgi:NADPH:quinone reductase-like Zn-dependent oxidoreductase